ncbi:MAG: hypothetical protein ACP5PB_06525 [Acidimicrobiales bacterium]
MAISLPGRYLVKSMARHPLPPRGTQLVMWSSPILLLVLVFTLTAHPTPASRRAPRNLAGATHDQASTPTSGPTTTTTSTAVTTTSTTVPPPRPARATTSGASYAAPIATTARSFAPDATANASSAVVAGQLTTADNVAVVPLDGPGTWTLDTSHPLVAQLQCPSTSTPVSQRVTIDGPRACQLELVATTATAWTLAPRP